MDTRELTAFACGAIFAAPECQVKGVANQSMQVTHRKIGRGRQMVSQIPVSRGCAEFSLLLSLPCSLRPHMHSLLMNCCRRLVFDGTTRWRAWRACCTAQKPKLSHGKKNRTGTSGLWKGSFIPA